MTRNHRIHNERRWIVWLKWNVSSRRRVIRPVRWRKSSLPTRFRPTNPVDEYAAGRVPVFFDRMDLAYLAHHCCCGDDADEATRERCGRIRFRCMAATHKLDAPASEVQPTSECDFIAHVNVIPTDRGGRQSSFATGYRPQLFIDGDDCDIEVQLEVDKMNPGDSGLVFCRFFRPDRNLQKLVVGKPVLLREGDRTIAYGTVLWRHTSEQSHALEPAAGPVSNGESSPPAQ